MHRRAPSILLLVGLALQSSCGSSGGPGGTGAGGNGGAPASSSTDAVTGSASDGSTSSAATTGTAGATTSGTGSAATSGSGGAAPCAPGNDYDQTILCDGPVAFWAMNKAGSEPDLTGHGNTGTYKGSKPTSVDLPNGDQAADFDGSSQYLTVPSKASLSIPTTQELTWEGWIRPDVVQFPNGSSDGYIDWMGKCENYSPTCEWEARLYDTTTQEVPNRPNRFSAYVFNPGAGLGSGADWQPIAGLVKAGEWHHVVGEYTLKTTPAACPNAATYPGSINIWVNGVEWSQSNHNPTGCMSQYQIKPQANTSALNIGTMAGDTWFQGAIGKVAIYDHLLTQAQITSHYTRMKGQPPTGTCANTCNF